jgi:hypothetical protein
MRTSVTTRRVSLPFLLIMAIMLTLAHAPDSADAVSGPIKGNTTCKALLGNASAYEIKVETSGIFNGAKWGPVTFKNVNARKTLMGFDSTVPVLGVFVKGGPTGGYFYDYRTSGTSSDTNMGTAGYGNGRNQISHVSLCWNEEPVIGQPGLTIEKKTNGEDADEPTGPSIPVGGLVTWTYEVKNTGNVPLTNVTVTDDKLAATAIVCRQDAPKNVIASLAVNATVTCTATGTATAGQYANVGTATDGVVSDTDPSHYFGTQAGLTIEKKTNGEDADVATGPSIPVGGLVTWTYEVKNTGNVPLTNITVTDDKLENDATAIVCQQAAPKNVIASLAVNATVTCTATGTATAGQYANVGTATDGVVSDTDPSHYFGTTPPPPPPPATFLVIDEDGIDNGPRYWSNSPASFTSSTIQTWSANDVNDDRPGLAQRLQLRWFASNVGQSFWFMTGSVGDEGWFAPKFIPSSWVNAGPTNDGLRNFLGNPTQPPLHNVGAGLGTGSNPEEHLDKIPHVIPLRAEGLWGLRGKTVCALVWDSDISINYDQGTPLGINGSLKSEKLGVVAFEVHDAVALIGFSSSTLPRVQVTVRDANEVCEGPLTLYGDAPEPQSSSVPMDVLPNDTSDNQNYAYVAR